MSIAACCYINTNPYMMRFMYGRRPKGRKVIEGLVGQRFGKLVAQSQLEPNQWRAIMVRCVCDCGSIVRTSYSKLRTGKKTSCDKGICDPHLKDISGKKFSYLTAIRPHKTTSAGTFWYFKCVCGDEVSRSVNAIVAGKQKSCGCMLPALVKAFWLRSTNPKRTVANMAYKGHLREAARRNLASALSYDDYLALAAQPCVYCGFISKRLHALTGSMIALNSVDRRNNEPYYSTENAVPCCFVCQKSKMQRSEHDFLEHARAIVRHRGAS